jgi:alpha-glucosidase
MQWDATEHAGFSTAQPWLPLSIDFAHENVVNLDADTKSILSLYRMLIALRKKRPELIRGIYEPIAAQDDLLLYRREADGNSVTVALNLGAEPVSVTSSSIGFGRKVLLSTFLDRDGEPIEGVLDLRGNEGVIIGEDAHAG